MNRELTDEVLDRNIIQDYVEDIMEGKLTDIIGLIAGGIQRDEVRTILMVGASNKGKSEVFRALGYSTFSGWDEAWVIYRGSVTQPLKSFVIASTHEYADTGGLLVVRIGNKKRITDSVVWKKDPQEYRRVTHQWMFREMAKSVSYRTYIDLQMKYGEVL